MSARHRDAVCRARRIILSAQRTHGHRLFVAYSGGKESTALVSLVRTVTPGALVIHFQCESEQPNLEFGVLQVRGPKQETTPHFLRYADLTAQLDGTRRAESGQLVKFGGREIDRATMPGFHTPNGYYGLEVYFPLWDWTDEELLGYLEEAVK